MPLPLLFIGIAAVTGLIGVGKTVEAVVDTTKASNLNKSAEELVKEATESLDRQRVACSKSLNDLGEIKLFVLNNSISQFLETFEKIKNVDFNESEGLEEISKLHIDQKDFEEMKSMVNFAGSIAGGAVAGTVGGAMVAFGAYGAAQAFAVASTGTAIASLSGAAATNATLAFFGGGSLATGGLGMAGGTVVLGGLVAGPALMVMGLIAGGVAKKNLEKAKINKDEAIQMYEQFSELSLSCEAIRRRTYVFYNLLARLDTYFLPLIYKMEDIFKAEGEDYRKYSTESKKTVASCASVAVTIKTVLDTALLTDEGLLTEESSGVAVSVEQKLKELKIIK